MEPPTPDERGFKDTTKVNPGYFTTVRAEIELPRVMTAPQSYVYHCHIVEHEDNDMMQPSPSCRSGRRAAPCAVAQGPHRGLAVTGTRS